MNLDNFDYVLPKENIAQEPTDIRTGLKVVSFVKKKIIAKKEDYFYNLLNHLSPNDLIIV